MRVNGNNEVTTKTFEILWVYKGVIVIDDNFLYSTLKSKMQIFVDRCASTDPEWSVGIPRDGCTKVVTV
ncbi:hypothetical protein BU26DRAFT_609571 [Trematosphaeria pertusa]|uniref:Uncharacterized protein n=1 Tax=Trematosphaeria pertusa TaxID=390896 RepID=A0A6A6I0M0_9PLEO|nr:uncharacterized protein BU26DRAFT_609571 [Trematosphaeria pertusa]KAF2243558.1 hypothetical protein BU26DRAFT_609571 [Trematosphaeria pertusa]